MVIKVFHLNFDILFEPNAVLDGEACKGYISYKEQKIVIDSTITKEKQKETLLHEILHAITAFLGYSDDLPKDNETMVMTLANGLATVFRDNPHLIEYLQK